MTVRVRVRRGGLLPATSHSIFYSRVGQIAIFSHCQPLDWEVLNEISLSSNPPIIVTVHGQTDLSGLVETEMVLIPDAHYPQLPLKLSVESSLPLTA